MTLTDIKYNNLKFKQLPPPIGGGDNTIHGVSRFNVVPCRSLGSAQGEQHAGIHPQGQ